MTYKRPIEFEFDFEKFLNLVVYLGNKVSDFDALKCAKLLYFIDKHHLVRSGRSITGDSYYRLIYGPVPTASYDLMKSVANPQTDINEIPDLKRLSEHFEVDESTEYPTFKPTEEADLEYFSRAELDSIEAVVSELGGLSAVDLMNRSHLDETHKRTRLNKPIDFRLFFESNPDALHDAREIMEAEQDNRDFSDSLARDKYTY